MSKVKKSLLEEGTIRQFMKLANIQPLTDNFITETYAGMDEDEEESADMPPVETEIEMDPMSGEEEAPEAPMDMEAGGALEGVSEEAVEELIGVVADALTGATGIEIDVTGGEEGMEGEEGLDMSPEAEADEAGMDFAPAVGEEGEEGEEEDVDDAAGLEEVSVVDEDAIMQETYRRVVKRLGDMNREHKLVESITEKVFSRLQNK